MPNDLKTQRNLLNSRPESRPESRPRSESQRQKLASSGFTASIWTLSGVVLVACSNVEDFLGLDDGGGGGGGGTLHVHSSPVQGARIYFDVDGGGVSPAEMAAQDAEHPQGFISNAEGRVLGVPNKFYGMPFEAHLDGAFDADTGESLSGILHSIPNPNEENNLHTLASPITEYFSDTDLTVEQLMIDIEDILPAGATEADVTAFLTQILDPNNYLDGGSGVEALADYLSNPQTSKDTGDVRSEVMDSLPMDTPTDTLTVDTTTLPAVTLGTYDRFVGKIDAVSHAGDVRYSFVDASANSIYTINARGVISVMEGATPTATTLEIRVSNTGSTDTEMVSVAVTVATSLPTLTPASDAPTATSATMGEDTAGGTALISGITASSGITADDFVIRTPDADGLASKFEIVDGTGGAFNLALKANEKLDFEALPTGTITLQVQAKDSVTGVRSEPLELTVMVEDANDAPVFIFGTDDNGLTDGTETVAENARQGMEVARVDAHDHDDNPDWNDVTYEITGGNTGDVFSIDNSGVIRVADASMLDYETTETYTLTVTATDSVDDSGTAEETNPTADDTIMVTINVMDINDNAPMVTADDDTIRSVMAADNTDTAGTDTGYSITITDADAEATNDFRVTTNDPRFSFERMGMTDTWNLVLLTNQAVSAGPLSLDYRVTDGANTDSGTIMLTVVDTPVAFMSPAAAARMATENDANWELQITATSLGSNSDGMDSAIASYDILEVRDASGAPVTNNGVFSISSTGLISISGALDYEMSASYAIDIEATDTPESGVSGHDEADTGTTTITVNVNNVEEGEATYEIALTDDNGATVTDLAVGVTLTPMVATDGADPDGIDRVVSYLWSRGDGSSLNGDATGATYTLMAGDSTTATYSVTITYIDGTDKTEVVEASTSSVSWDVVPSYDPAANPLTDGEAPMANDPVIPNTAISASGGDGKIEYSIEDPSGVFQIHPNSGALSVSENGPAVWDFETTPSYEIFIIATDVDDGSTMGTGDTARIPVTINITDANDAPVVEGVQVTANDPLAMAGIATLAGATTGDDSALTGTADAEYIYGDAGADTITGGGGADHIIGGAGTDGITLSSDANNVETIYYRFSSAGSFPAEIDGTDTINGFRRGEDRLVLIDTDSESTLALNTLLSDAQNAAINVASFAVNPLFDVAITEATVNLIGMEIQFDEASIIIKYDSGSYVTVRSGGSWQTAGDDYLGVLSSGVPSELGTSGGLLDNTLLPNYFGDTGNTNLQITGDDITANLGIDVLISEKRNAEDGFFATVSATDPDGTAPIMRYDISGGTGMGLFVVNVMGEISVGDGVNVGEGGRTTLDFDTTSEYTLEITATDAGGATSDPTTITIGLIENGEAEYSLALTGTMLTATRDTADPEGLEAGSVAMYRWYTTTDGGTNKAYLGAASTANTLDTSISGNEAPTNAVHGVEITYTDGVGIDESIDVRQSTISFTSSDSREYTRAVLDGFITDGDDVGVRILTANIIGTGTAQYAITGGADRAHFSITNTELLLNASSTGFPTTQSSFVVEITATDSVTMDTDVQTFTVTVTASSPAIIPDRQAFAHQDPYEPNDDQNDQTNQDNPQTPPDIM